MIIKRILASVGRRVKDTADYIRDAAHAALGAVFGPKVVAYGTLNVTNLETLEAASFQEVAQEIRSTAKDYHGQGQPSFHLVVTWPEGERPSHEQMEEAAKIVLKHLGLSGQPALWGAHGNTRYSHLHVKVDRLHYDDHGQLRILEGQATVTKCGHNNNAESLQVALAEICAVQGWRAAPNARYGPDLKPRIQARDPDEIKLRPRLLDAERRTGKPHPIRKMGEAARDIIRLAHSWPQVRSRLNQAGLRLDIRPSGEGAVLTGAAGHLRLSALPDDCTLKALYQRLGDPRETVSFHRAGAVRRAQAARQFAAQRHQPKRIHLARPESVPHHQPPAEPEGVTNVNGMEDRGETVFTTPGFKPHL